uniref:non-reducing end alpha-L-arabinofuranosidase n=1 Tax=Oryza punctata TaxID=4537 RepID=A0A0E0KNK6_ORYPU
MGSKEAFRRIIFCVLLLLCVSCKCLTSEVNATQLAVLKVDASPQHARKIPETLFGIFFEEINHAGAGGIWAELVSNRGFEAGGPNTPSSIDPWSIIGNESVISVATDRSSCFSRNIIALRMEVLCGDCQAGGVGIYNPGFWGMNIEDGKNYSLVMYAKSLENTELTVSLTSSDGLQNLSSATIQVAGTSNWTKLEQKLVAKGTNRTSRLQITTNKKGVIWLDQISLMPSDTYKGHGFRKELVSMLLDLKPQFMRFPGGCFVEGHWLRNAFRWRESVGPWEERPGHFGDVPIGIISALHFLDYSLIIFSFEYNIYKLSEDLGAAPIWVFNNGFSHNEEINTTAIAPFDILDSLEFTRGSTNSTWGSLRVAMGHPEPFPVKYVTIGNEDCTKKFYHGNYLKFHSAIREAYPDIQIISNCDGSSKPLDHPADIYDFHVYGDSNTLFSMRNKFDSTPRNGPKAFVSEYAVSSNGVGRGTLLASLAEAAFLTGLEKNSDVVQMASYAPLFMNDNDRSWNPAAIVFNSWKQYGSPSYWMQTIFRESSGAVLHPVTINSMYSNSLAASAITWKTSSSSFLRVKIVNIGSNPVNLIVSTTGLEALVNMRKSTVTILTSKNLSDENSLSNPTNVRVVPVTRELPNAGEEMFAFLGPYSFTSFDLALGQQKHIS